MKCGKPIPDPVEEFCINCKQVDFSFDSGRSLFVHQGDVVNALYLFKFQNHRIFGEIFANVMADFFREQVNRWNIDTVIPIPVHPRKKRKRGFNQTEVLASNLCQKLNLDYAPDILYRIRDTKPQKELSLRQRQQNLNGSFGISRKWQPTDCVLLVDDIYTTGSTIHHVSKILKRIGVRKVYFLTVSIGQYL